MENLVLAAAAGFGVWYVLDDDGDATPVKSFQVAPGVVAVQGGKQNGVTTSGSSQLKPRSFSQMSQRVPSRRIFSSQHTDPYVQGGNPAQKAAQQLLHELELKFKEEYDKLTAEAKQKGADALNEAYPGIGVKATDSAAVLGQKIGSYAGGKGAEAGCTAMGLSDPGSLSVCNKLGAMVGAYLGEELGPWISDKWDDLSDWVTDQWDSVSEGISDAAGDAWDETLGRLF